MDKLTTTFDAVFDYYAEATGQLPTPYLTYQGRSLVAEVDVSCGAGCGFLGATGVELAAGYFGVLYDGVRLSDQSDQVLFYEFGRNFYFYDSKIRYKESGPLAAPVGQSGWIGTGYAVLMRFASMDATGVKPAAYGGAPFATFRASVEGMVDTYVATPALNFQNTLLINQHPDGGGTTDFFASLCRGQLVSRLLLRHPAQSRHAVFHHVENSPQRRRAKRGPGTLGRAGHDLSMRRGNLLGSSPKTRSFPELRPTPAQRGMAPICSKRANQQQQISANQRDAQQQDATCETAPQERRRQARGKQRASGHAADCQQQESQRERPVERFIPQVSDQPAQTIERDDRKR